MLVKDVKGKFYEVDEKVLSGKEIDEEKAMEAMAAERAEKRKKISEMLSKLDPTEYAILRDNLIGRMRGRQMRMPPPGGPMQREAEPWQYPPREWDCPQEFDCPPDMETSRYHYDCPWYWYHWDCRWYWYHWDCEWYWDYEREQIPRDPREYRGPQAPTRAPQMQQRPPRRFR